MHFLTFLIVLIFMWRRITEYSKRAPNTKKIQAMTQACRAFRPSAFGEFVVMALKMLMRTKKRVTRRAMRPWRWNADHQDRKPMHAGPGDLDVVRGNEEGGPGHYHKETAWEVVGDDVVGNLGEREGDQDEVWDIVSISQQEVQWRASPSCS